jgi:hypothetical protein
MTPRDKNADPRAISVAAPGRWRLVAEIRFVERGELLLQPPLVAAVIRQAETRERARLQDVVQAFFP